MNKAIKKLTQKTKKALVLSVLASTALTGISSAYANSRDQAARIHHRLAGVPASETVLDAMEALVATGNQNDAIAAAQMAMENVNFYNVTLRNFAMPWTNEAQTVFDDMNDYVATVVGMIRDDEDFRTVLYGDILYVGAGNLGLPAYSMTNNDHYRNMDIQGVDLKAGLVKTSQSSVMTGIPTQATAGIMTTRAAAKSFFIDGTNRAMFRFTLMNHLCNDLEQVKEVTRTPDKIRRDVSRSPGGDSRIYLNSCIGCHAGMDPLAQAFAYYEWQYDFNTDPQGINGQLIYNDVGELDPSTGLRVTRKHHINANNFKYGYEIPDDSWSNYWRNGPNSLLGWDSQLPGSGSGAKTMGQELAHSETFATCQVEKVFKAVCLRTPRDSTDRSQIQSMVSSFKASGYKMKQVFAESAVYCKGD